MESAKCYKSEFFTPESPSLIIYQHTTDMRVLRICWLTKRKKEGILVEARHNKEEKETIYLAAKRSEDSCTSFPAFLGESA